mmetsp:Transcript_17428/g.2876  ORF Transcript_17428/g.2876 Transcript_17428/m.2876 type:complete len:104 (-) Transcript_17428:399-710(-)
MWKYAHLVLSFHLIAVVSSLLNHVIGFLDYCHFLAHLNDPVRTVSSFSFLIMPFYTFQLPFLWFSVLLTPVLACSFPLLNNLSLALIYQKCYCIPRLKLTQYS